MTNSPDVGVLWDVRSIPLMFAQSFALLLARPKPFFSALLGCEDELALSQDCFSTPNPQVLTPRSCRADFLIWGEFFPRVFRPFFLEFQAPAKNPAQNSRPEFTGEINKSVDFPFESG